jgi:hypothetical protein
MNLLAELTELNNQLCGVLTEFALPEPAVLRHYYKAAKKASRGGFKTWEEYWSKNVLPSSRNSGSVSQSGLALRGVGQHEADALLKNGKTEARWSADKWRPELNKKLDAAAVKRISGLSIPEYIAKYGAKGTKRHTWLTSSKNTAAGYASTANMPNGERMVSRFTGVGAVKPGSILGFSPKVMNRVDRKMALSTGNTSTTAPVRGGMRDEDLRVVLDNDNGQWKPRSLIPRSTPPAA